MLIYLFGLPAAGKNYVGRVLAEEFGYTFYDGDLDLTPEMRDAVREERPFTAGMRDRYYAILIDRIAELRAGFPDLAFGQATFKEHHRQLVQSAFPDVVFVLVEASAVVRAERLSRGGTRSRSNMHGGSTASSSGHVTPISSSPTTTAGKKSSGNWPDCWPGFRPRINPAPR